MIPQTIAWHLTDLSEARGKQALFTKQSPQRLKVLREHALIKSVVSSNRIEGVEVNKSRVGTLIFGKPAFEDRDEEEVSGYRDALKLIHERGAKLPISEATIKRLHKLSRGKIWDAGKYIQLLFYAGHSFLNHLQLLQLFPQFTTPQLCWSYFRQWSRHTAEPLLARLGPAFAAARQDLPFAHQQVAYVILDLRAPAYQVLPISDQRPPPAISFARRVSILIWEKMTLRAGCHNLILPNTNLN